MFNVLATIILILVPSSYCVYFTTSSAIAATAVAKNPKNTSSNKAEDNSKNSFVLSGRSISSSLSGHHRLKLMVNGNPSALKGKAGKFSQDVEWVPLDPVEYKTTIIPKEEMVAAERALLNPKSEFQTSAQFIVKPQKLSGTPTRAKWLDKLATKLYSKIDPNRKDNRNGDEGLEINKGSFLKLPSTAAPVVPKRTLPIGTVVRQTTPQTQVKKKVWIPVSISIPQTKPPTTQSVPIAFATSAKPTTRNSNKKNFTLPYRWSGYYEGSDDPLTSALLTGVLQEQSTDNWSIPEADPPEEIRRPPHQMVTSWSSTSANSVLQPTKATSEPVIQATTPTIHSTTYSVTAHPLVIASEPTASEFSISGHGEDFESEDYSLEYQETEFSTNEPTWQRTSTTTMQSIDRNYVQNGYHPSPVTQRPYYHQYTTTTDGGSNTLTSFLTTTTMTTTNSIAETASTTTTTNSIAKPASTTKKPLNVYSYQIDPQPSGSSSNSGNDGGWGSNRLQRLLLAIGMSVIPTAALAVIVGFPSLLGRRKREVVDQQTFVEFVHQIEMMEKENASLWMNEADETLRRYCAQVPLNLKTRLSRKMKSRKKLRGQKAWNGVADAIRNLVVSQQKNNKTVVKSYDKGGADGVIYFPAIPDGKAKELVKRLDTKRNVSENKNLPKVLQPFPKPYEWNDFICKTFWSLMDGGIAVTNPKKISKSNIPLASIKIPSQSNALNQKLQPQEVNARPKQRPNSRFESPKVSAAKVYDQGLLKSRSELPSSTKPVAVIIVHHRSNLTDLPKSPASVLLQSAKFDQIPKQNDSAIDDAKVTSLGPKRKHVNNPINLTKNWTQFSQMVNVLSLQTEKPEFYRRLSGTMKPNKFSGLLLSPTYPRSPRLRRHTDDGRSHEVQQSNGRKVQSMVSPTNNLNTKDKKTSNSSILTNVTNDIPQRKVFIYHILALPKEKKPKDTKTEGKNFSIAQIVPVTPVSPVKELKNDHPMNKQLRHEEYSYAIPSLIRIPINVENSITPSDHAQILANQILRPLLQNFHQERPYLINNDRSPATINWQDFLQYEDQSRPVEGTNSHATNAHAGPTTINIYTIHGLQNGILPQLLSNMYNQPEDNAQDLLDDNDSFQQFQSSTPPHPSYFIRRTTKRPQTLQTLQQQNLNFKPVRVRPFIRPRPSPSGSPPFRQPPIDECDPAVDECFPDPVIPSLPPARRPPFRIKKPNPQNPVLQFLNKKFGFQGGLIPLFDLGNVAHLANKIDPFAIADGPFPNQKWQQKQQWRVDDELNPLQRSNPGQLNATLSTGGQPSDPQSAAVDLMRHILVKDFTKSKSMKKEKKNENFLPQHLGKVKVNKINLFVPPGRDFFNKLKRQHLHDKTNYINLN